MIMNNKTLYFALGFVCGSIASYMTTRKKYEEIVQRELDSIKEHFHNDSKKRNEELNSMKENIFNDKTDKEKINDIINNRRYAYNKTKKTPVDYGDKFETKKVDEERSNYNMNRPYVIPPEEFGEKEDYETISLTYYSGDKVLVDDYDSVIENVDEIVGKSSLNRFGEYEDDSVFVRNDVLGCDYEILLERGNFYKDKAELDE